MDAIVSLTILVLGTSFVVYCRYLTPDVRRTWSWVPSMGQITRSEVVIESSGGPGGPTRIHKPVIEYIYWVEGREYRSYPTTLGGTFHTGLRHRAEASRARYPVGAAIPILHDPSSPEHTCLKRTAAGNDLLTLVCIGITALAALLRL